MQSAFQPIRNMMLTGLLLTAPLSAGQIEAVKGKQYRLTKQHGPWMIMVSSFRDVTDPNLKMKGKQGLSAQEAADQVVYELRKKGIPAYTFAQDAMKGEIKTVDRSGREDLRIYAAQRDMICVIAGNYASQEDATGERTLKFIKTFTPDFMKEASSGAIYRLKADRGAFGGAFMTVNPLLDPAEIARKKPDLDLRKLNYGIQNGLIDNPSKYTVQVATFTGRSVTPIANSSLANKEEEFDRRLQSTVDENGHQRTNLGASSEEAAQLAMALRRRGFDAWVYHDRYESIVTIGSFDNPQDPQIAGIVKNFGSKSRKDQSGNEVMVAEVLTPDVTQVSHRRKAPTQMWVFDPQPRLIEVPHQKVGKKPAK